MGHSGAIIHFQPTEVVKVAYGRAANALVQSAFAQDAYARQGLWVPAIRQISIFDGCTQVRMARIEGVHPFLAPGLEETLLMMFGQHMTSIHESVCDMRARAEELRRFVQAAQISSSAIKDALHMIDAEVPATHSKTAHGDLTFMNALVTARGEVYTFDIIPTFPFVEIDYAKLRQETRYGWSEFCGIPPPTPYVSAELDLMLTDLMGPLDPRFELFVLLRILPYADLRTFAWIERSVQQCLLSC